MGKTRCRSPSRDGGGRPSDGKWKVLLAFLFLFMAACVGYMVYLLHGYHAARHEYEITRQALAPLLDGEGTEPDVGVPSRFPERDIDIGGLLAANPDFAFWLYYPDGKVDYPVTQEPDDDINKYLHLTFEGKANAAGCPFITYDADPGLRDLNTFVYGHNMKDGSMFGSLKHLYRDPSGNFSDPYFYVWTRDGERILYRVIGMQVVDKDDAAYSVPGNAAGYREYVDAMLASGSTDGFVPFTDEERDAIKSHSPVVSLSTCFGSAGTRKRLLVQGVELLREPF